MVCRALLCLAALTMAAGRAEAQSRPPADAVVSLTGAGLITLQPADGAWVGSPYLDKGLAGVGPGLAVGMNVVAGRWFTMTAEYGTGWLSVEQTGRNAAPIHPSDCSFGGPCSSTGRLHDSMLSALGGVHTRVGSARLQWLAGVSRLFGTPTGNDVALVDTQRPAPRRMAFTAGADFVRGLGSRTSLVVTGRYFHVDRSERARQRGVGRHVVRVGVGVRIALQATGG